MEWEDISEVARKWMTDLGSFGPTANVKDRFVKGWTLDEDGDITKTYLDSEGLRQLSIVCNEVADWLDRRAINN